MTISDELLNLFEQRKVIPFIGSGCSKLASEAIPDWKELTKSFASEMPDIEFKEDNVGDYLKVIGIFERRYGREKLCTKLRYLLDTTKVDIFNSELHIALLEIPCSNLYTTNFDDLLEKSYEAINKPFQKIVTLKDIAEINYEKVQILKFHGDLSNQQSIVITESDYHRRFEFKDPMDIRLKADALGKSLLFLGYSFSDPNIRYLWHTLNQIGVGKEGMPPSYIILIKPDILAIESFRGYGIKVIEIEHPKELIEFTQKLSRQIFNSGIKKSVDELFSKNIPRRILTPLIFKHLKEYIKDDKVSVTEKVEKLRQILDICFIPQILWDDFSKWIEEVISQPIDIEIKKNLAISINHIKNPLFIIPLITLLFDNSLSIEDKWAIAFPIETMSFPDRDPEIANAIAELILSELNKRKDDIQFIKSERAEFIFHILRNFKNCKVLANPDANDKKEIDELFEKYKKANPRINHKFDSRFPSGAEIFKRMYEKLPKHLREK